MNSWSDAALDSKNMNNGSRFYPRLLVVGCFLVLGTVSLGAEITMFTGADPGEGVDFEGDFVYAVNIGGSGGHVIGDAQFSADDKTVGFDILAAFGSDRWATPEYGDSDADNALELMMQSMRMNFEPDPVDILMDVQAEASYKLQMMFHESCCDASFDIFLDDEMIGDDFTIWQHHKVKMWANMRFREDGVLITHEFVATENTLHLVLGGDDPAHNNANNALLGMLTLEQLGGSVLQAGDADMDFDFDQLDLVQVQIAGKFLTSQPATWGEGDWNGAPGGEPGSPPPGDGRFDQLDIVAALIGGVYLTGPYAAVKSGGSAGDGQTSIGYNPTTGEVFVDAPAGTELTSINIDSAAGIFTGQAARNLGGSFDNDADTNIFKATFGSSFGSLSLGNVAQTGLSEDFVLSDLSIVGSRAGGGDLGEVDLIYVPEPSSIVVLVLGLAVILAAIRMF